MAEVTDRVITVPNLLSFLRLALVPVFLVLILSDRDVLALVVLVVSSVTDFLDGLIARKFRQISRLGQLLDPSADRLFIFAALIGLSVREVIPWWFFIAIVARELLLVIMGIVGANFGYGPLPVHHLGKAATLCLLYALPLIMIGQAFPVLAIVTDPVGWSFGLWGLFLYWWAGIIYLAETARIIRIPRPEVAVESDTLGS